MNLPIPEIKVEGDKVMALLPLVQVDLDGDGVKSIDVGLYANVVKAELAQEIIAKAMASGKLGEALKKMLGL